MKIIDHGKWIPYKPAKDAWPEGAPRHALFSKRESDGVDWYDYVKTAFQADSVKIAFMFHDYEQQWIIGPAVIDPTMIFPPNHYVREILDFGSTDEDEIIAAFRNKAVDPDTTEILGHRYTPPPPSAEELRVMNDYPKIILDLIARIEKLERLK
jgi:hypothetical protein